MTWENRFGNHIDRLSRRLQFKSWPDNHSGEETERREKSYKL